RGQGNPAGGGGRERRRVGEGARIGGRRGVDDDGRRPGVGRRDDRAIVEPPRRGRLQHEVRRDDAGVGSPRQRDAIGDAGRAGAVVDAAGIGDRRGHVPPARAVVARLRAGEAHRPRVGGERCRRRRVGGEAERGSRLGSREHEVGVARETARRVERRDGPEQQTCGSVYLEPGRGEETVVDLSRRRRPELHESHIRIPAGREHLVHAPVGHAPPGGPRRQQHEQGRTPHYTREANPWERLPSYDKNVTLPPWGRGARVIGRVLDKYEILEEVGQGGMAVVYRGRDRMLQRDVAVKVLHPHLASAEEARRRFEREAHAVAKLRHENILEIFDYSGTDSADSYIVTEFINGRTLKG